MNGAYLLVMELPKDLTVRIGKLGRTHFEKGWYVYVGSALNGLDQRIQRHLRKEKKIHWHIDYLLLFTKNMSIYYKENNRKEECTLASCFQTNLRSIPGFGCSDCFCPSHLFFGSSEEIIRIVEHLKMKQYLLDTNP